MTGGAYLPPEVGHNSQRDGEHLGGNLRYGRNGNVYGAAGVMSSDIPGLAPPPGMRPYLPAADGGLANYGVTAMEDVSIMVQDKRGMGFDTPIGSGSILNPRGGRQDFFTRQELPAVQTGGPGLGLLPLDASATLYVEGIPADCKRREAAHIFRPFIGFKEVRLVYKEAKRPGGDQLVLCFVDFADARCATIALEALQGYKLDENDPASPMLKLQFARVPGPRVGPYRDNSGGRHERVNRP